jgi:hypothetical protein
VAGDVAMAIGLVVIGGGAAADESSPVLDTTTAATIPATTTAAAKAAPTRSAVRRPGRGDCWGVFMLEDRQKVVKRYGH